MANYSPFCLPAAEGCLSVFFFAGMAKDQEYFFSKGKGNGRKSWGDYFGKREQISVGNCCQLITF